MPRKPERAPGSTEGVVLRPEATVLPSGAIVPAANLIEPAPNQFSHELIDDEPYHYGVDPASPADGTLAPGTRVLLVADDGRYANVIDEHGLYVRVRRRSLRPIGPS
jgi:hypothetical protein